MILGLGVDIIAPDRFERHWKSDHRRFFNRLFTPAEIAYCQGMHHPPMHFAARFAAKEALLKALGTGLRAPFAWKEIEVVRDARGKPAFALHGMVAEHVRGLGGAVCHLTLSHTEALAVAAAVVESTSATGGIP